MEILEYLTVDGRSPYRNWFDELDARAAAKVAVAFRESASAISRTPRASALAQEYRIDFGPGCRIYFG